MHKRQCDTKASDRDKDGVESNNGSDYTSLKRQDGGGKEAGTIEEATNTR